MNSRFKRTLLAAAAAAVLLCGCDLASSSGDAVSLAGRWISAYGDGFEISGSDSSGYLYTQYDDSSRNVSFAGSIVNDPDLYDTSGYIIIKITDSGTWVKQTGYYLSIHWKSLSDVGVALSSAYKTGSQYNNGIATETEAALEYTVENGYFGYYGEYQKQ